MSVLTALAGRRVLLVDLDPQGHDLHLGVDPDPAASHAYDVLVDHAILDDALVKDVRPGLDFPARWI